MFGITRLVALLGMGMLVLYGAVVCGRGSVGLAGAVRVRVTNTVLVTVVMGESAVSLFWGLSYGAARVLLSSMRRARMAW